MLHITITTLQLPTVPSDLPSQIHVHIYISKFTVCLDIGSSAQAWETYQCLHQRKVILPLSAAINF